MIITIMALKIKQNNNIDGITVVSTDTGISKEFKISQLADDTVLFLNNIQSANISLEEVKHFGNTCQVFGNVSNKGSKGV